MSANEEEVRAQVKVVEDKEVELCIAHLRFLSKFYITVIENKRAQMNMAHTQFLANKEDYSAYSEWTGAKKKIIDLYTYWLRELLNISIVDDLRALCMHQMMAADCYWFLAKMHQPTFHFGHSNYEMACRCMVKILNSLFDLLPQHNKFVIHLVHKYSLIVLDYRKEVGLKKPKLMAHMNKIPAALSGRAGIVVAWYDQSIPEKLKSPIRNNNLPQLRNSLPPFRSELWASLRKIGILIDLLASLYHHLSADTVVAQSCPARAHTPTYADRFYNLLDSLA